MAATFDEKLFCVFENQNVEESYVDIVERSLLIKKAVVEKDEKESGLRRVLNFGHTVGHAIEKGAGLGTLYHGECVAVGMMYTSYGQARERIKKVLQKLELPIQYSVDKARLAEDIKMDKKASGNSLSLVTCGKIGSYEIRKIMFDDIDKLIDGKAESL